MRPRESHGLLVLLASAATLSAPGTARAQDGWQFGPSLQVRHTGAGFRIRVNSYVHGDLRARRNFTDDVDGPEGLNGTETWLRRTRIGVEGEWRRFSFLVTADPARRRRAAEGLVR